MGQSHAPLGPQHSRQAASKHAGTGKCVCPGGGCTSECQCMCVCSCVEMSMALGTCPAGCVAVPSCVCVCQRSGTNLSTAPHPDSRRTKFNR